MPKSSEVTVVARLRAAPGKAEALAAMLTEQVGVVRKAEPGCLAYRLHRFEQLSGRSLSATADLAEIWLALRAAEHVSDGA